MGIKLLSSLIKPASVTSTVILQGSSKEQLIDLQQQLKVHKELYRQAQDELEELRALVEDLQGQLNDYRNKVHITELENSVYNNVFMY